jgi:hypothetical protein
MKRELETEQDVRDWEDEQDHLANNLVDDRLLEEDI